MYSSKKLLSNKNNLQVLYEDNHIIVVNKRAGDIVQGDKTGDTPLSDIVKHFLAEKYNKTGNVFLGVVHRLDRPTTGIVLFSKTSKALPRLNKIFAEKKAKKTYWALVKNEPPRTKDTLTHWLKKNTKTNPNFIEENLNDICASIQHTIIQILMDKVKNAVKHTGIKHIAIAGGVSANSGIRNILKESEQKFGWTTYIPKFEYTTDNAAMIAITGYYDYLRGNFTDSKIAATARLKVTE